MNRHTTKRLKSICNSAPGGCDKKRFRRFKKDYNEIPRNERHQFLTTMEKMGTMMAAQIAGKNPA